jgi:hypothetical protein
LCRDIGAFVALNLSCQGLQGFGNWGEGIGNGCISLRVVSTTQQEEHRCSACADEGTNC